MKRWRKEKNQAKGPEERKKKVEKTKRERKKENVLNLKKSEGKIKKGEKNV